MNSFVDTETKVMPNGSTWPRLSAYAELTKLRISVMVLLTYLIAGMLAANAEMSLARLAWGAIAMALIAASGNALNMYLERYTDFLMPRTATRPLPAQRLGPTEVALFAAVCFGISVGIFFSLVNWQAGLCGLLTWFLYVFVYTPLKTRTWLNTEVGAVPGALPVLMGALAATGTINAWAWTLFGVLLLWQFPHFMAIAWIYRDQYQKAGHRMLTVVDPTGHRAGRKAILTALMLLLVSLIPVGLADGLTWQIGFGLAAFTLGWMYLRSSIQFARERNDTTARRLLRVSIVYLPVYMILLILVRQI